MFLPWQNVYKYQCKELYLEHKKGYSAEKSWLFKVKNRLLRQHLGGPLIPNPQLSQLAVEGHVPSNLVSQFQQLRKGFFWDTLYITTMCNMPATEKHNPQHTFTCSQHRRLLGVQRSNDVRFMSLCNTQLGNISRIGNGHTQGCISNRHTQGCISPGSLHLMMNCMIYIV